MTTIGTLLYTFFKGRLLGRDAYGNKYYEAKSEVTAEGKKKRWVIYNGLAEPTKVPPDWHGWLHYTQDAPPTLVPQVRHAWLKEPQPNLTGTTLAYVPPGHVSRGAKRARTVGDYEPWKP
jgi:NADH:ubiquinone oxidoreductase subunit